MSLLAAFTWGQWLLGAGLIAVCGLLILVILVQQASGGGLVGAFGGGGGGGAFGAKTGDAFTVITCSLAGVYLFMAVIGNYVLVPPTVAEPPAIVLPESLPVTLPVTPAATPPAGSTPITPGATGIKPIVTPSGTGNAGAAGSTTPAPGAADDTKAADETSPPAGEDKP